MCVIHFSIEPNGLAFPYIVRVKLKQYITLCNCGVFTDKTARDAGNMRKLLLPEIY